MRKYLRTTYYTGAILFFIIVAIFGYTQTSVFKNYLRKIILKEANTVVNGTIAFGHLDGNLITNVSIDSVFIYNNKNDIIKSDKIEISYDPFSLLFNTISINSISIIKPNINIYCSKDSVWNISNLFKTSSANSSTNNWAIDIKNIHIVDANITFTDSTDLFYNPNNDSISKDLNFDYSNFKINKFNFDGSVIIQEDVFTTNINNLEFNTDNHFVLNNLAGKFYLSKNDCYVKNLKIETPSSNLILDAEIKEVDITSIQNISELKNKNVKLNLNADSLDSKDLQYFLYPDVDFLSGKFKVQVSAVGPFNDIYLDRVSVKMPKSYVELHGFIRNLHNTQNLSLSVYGNNNYVDPNDLLHSLPGLKLPDLSFLGKVNYALNYEGEPLDFKSNCVFETELGTITIDGNMKIEERNTSYAAKINTTNLDISKLINDTTISSNINSNISIDATGFNLKSMIGVAKIEIDSSILNNLPLNSSVIILDVADGILRTHLSALLGKGKYEFSTFVKHVKNDSIIYNGTGKFRSIDLEELLQDRKYFSNLSFDINAGGSIGNNTRNDTAEIFFYESSFKKEFFEDGYAKITYDINDSSNLDVTSSIADISVNGNFTANSFLSSLNNSYKLITEAIANRFTNLDSLRGTNKNNFTLKSFNPSVKSNFIPLNAHFNIDIKNLKPFGEIINVPLAGQGLIDGNIESDSTLMLLNGSTYVEQFGIMINTDSIYLDNGLIQFNFGGIQTQSMLDNFNSNLSTEFNDFTLNGFLFNNINGNLFYHNDSTSFNYSVLIDSTALIKFDGTTKIDSNFMTFKIPNLQINVGEHNSINKDTVKLILGQNGMLVNNLSLISNSEQANVSGYFNLANIFDLDINVNQFQLSNLHKLLYRGPFGRSSTRFNGIANGSFHFGGTLLSPDVDLKFTANNVIAKNISEDKNQNIGEVNTHLSYNNYMLNIDASIIAHENENPDLLINGTMPYEFVLARTEPKELTGNVDITIKSNALNLNYLEPFVPELSNLSGTAICDMKIIGSINSPIYEGSVSIYDAKFIFNPLGIGYILNGDIIPSKNKLRFSNFTIQNDPNDKANKNIGTMNVEGNFSLLGLKLNEFDLLFKGNLNVMSESRINPEQKYYGDIFIETDNNGLIWNGNLDKSKVSGTIFTKDAHIVFPPEKEAELVRVSQVKLIHYDDTSNTSTQTKSLQEKKSQNLKKENTDNIKSFLDGIDYDVSIETQGPTSVRFIFSTQLQEELFANIEGRLYYNKTPEISRLTGQLEVGNRSYYRYLKQLDATGKLLFTGDALNPELDVVASHKGIHKKSDTSSTSIKNVGEESGDEDVLITLNVTGTRKIPKVKMSIQTKSINDRNWLPWTKGDEEANAMIFLATNQYRDEFTEQQRMGLVGANLGAGLVTGMVTGPLSDLLRKSTAGHIQSIDIISNSGRFDQYSDIRMVGQLKEVVIKWGGQVFDDFANSNISFEIPFSSLLGPVQLRNLILTLERRVEGIQNTEQRRSSNGARLFYRFIF